MEKNERKGWRGREERMEENERKGRRRMRGKDGEE